MGQKRKSITGEGPLQTLETVKYKNSQDTDNVKLKIINPKVGQPTTRRKKDIANIIRDELASISNLFDVMDIASLNHGRRNLDEDDDDSEWMDVPEKKVFSKNTSKKRSTPSALKNKSFPQSIEGLEKELEELKGTPMNYQKKMRKKGLQSRLLKKKKKEVQRQQKFALKQGKVTGIGGPFKPIKPVFNSDGNVVTNKFDFADSDLKKDVKRKSEVNHSTNQANTLDSSMVSKVKNESDGIEKTTKITNSENKSHQGPLFNKDNKMVFSKVFVPENLHKKTKKKGEKDPVKILQKIKENTKKISELEKQDKDKAVLLKEKHKWTAALKRAGGEKVRDDPELLRKTITREKNKKVRSQKKWQARIEKEQKEKDDRQEKRTKNIQARKSEKKKKKMKRAIKKGSFVQV